jgi:hypothetical protein
MSKTPTAVYKCLQPELVDAYEKRVEEIYAAYRVKTKALMEEWGVEELCQRSNYDGNWITGYVPKDWKEEPKPGFRKDRDSGFMVPAKRTAEGKAIVKRLEDVQYVPGRKPGLPKMIWGEGYMGPMSIEKLNGTWFAYCTVPLREPDAKGSRGDGLSEVDPAIWEPVKLSEYFLAAEAQEAKV